MKIKPEFIIKILPIIFIILVLIHIIIILYLNYPADILEPNNELNVLFYGFLSFFIFFFTVIHFFIVISFSMFFGDLISNTFKKLKDLPQLKRIWVITIIVFIIGLIEYFILLIIHWIQDLYPYSFLIGTFCLTWNIILVLSLRILINDAKRISRSKVNSRKKI